MPVDGWRLRPGLRGARADGTAWSPLFTVRGVESDVDQQGGGGWVLVNATDEQADLRLQIRLTLHPSGVPVTRRGVGAGAAWYLGTRLDPTGLDEVLGTALHQAGVDPAIEGLPAGVEAVRRRGADSEYLFVMNHTGGALIVPVEGADLLTGVPWSPETSLPGGDVAVIRC